MRLLNTTMSDTGEFAMEEFSGQEVQPYAILSHTWGEDEVCFQDMERADAANKKGYEKVKNFCSLAKANGYKYVWVDTCCIDKRSSAELSEAINSMYRWYEEADVCYAYLADVSSLSNFSDSRWFTRGWTLQELIAPSNVIFFDRDWQVIGNKADLHNFFLGDSLGYASVAQRMSWAASRETTRIEDRAYCLLGIFGIYMPMLYGEGDRAFIRLQEEIMKGMDDHSLFAWRSTAYHDGGILASSPAAFVESGNIVSTSSFKAASSSPAISNARGIRLSVPFKYSQQRESGLAILDSAASGRGTVAKLLLERGAYVDSKDENHQTPLSRAAANGNGIVVKLLLEKGANLDSKDKYNRTPIYLAAKNGRITTVKLLLDHGATYPRFMEEKVVKLLLFKNGVNLESGDKHGQTSLSWAASNGHTAVVKHLLRAAPLSRAAERDKDGIVQLLLDWGANMEERSADGLTPLSWAAMYGHEAITALLLRKGANIEARSDTGQTALSWSAIFGREATMRVLLDRGANIETRSGKGQTPLSWAAVRGANIESRSKNSYTPLLWALHNKHYPIAKLLFHKGASRYSYRRQFSIIKARIKILAFPLPITLSSRPRI
ncbi:ankyrin repeat-containing protein [Nemania serpens]|nr:ankyrin repeat-containing protein [Nemania serpens]